MGPESSAPDSRPDIVDACATRAEVNTAINALRNLSSLYFSLEGFPTREFGPGEVPNNRNGEKPRG